MCECPGSGQAQGMWEHSPVPNLNREVPGEAMPEKYLLLANRGRAEMVPQAGEGAPEGERFQTWWNPQARQRVVRGEGGRVGWLGDSGPGPGQMGAVKQ